MNNIKRTVDCNHKFLRWIPYGWGGIFKLMCCSCGTLFTNEAIDLDFIDLIPFERNEEILCVEIIE